MEESRFKEIMLTYDQEEILEKVSKMNERDKARILRQCDFLDFTFLKALKEKLQSRPLKFANENELMDILGLIPGQVTPLGTLNDSEHKVKVVISSYFRDGLMDAHPNDNTATVILKTADVAALLESFGVSVEYLEI